MKIQLIRCRFGTQSTHGLLFVDGKFFGYTLEDIVRLPFEKVQHKTAIQSGDYFVKMQYSSHFHKEKLFLQHVHNFDGIMIHEGHDADDSSGCILLAKGMSFSGLRDSILAVNELQQMYKLAVAKGEKCSIHICDSLFDLVELNSHCPVDFNELLNHVW